MGQQLANVETIENTIKDFVNELKQLISFKDAYANIAKYSSNIVKKQRKIIENGDSQQLLEFAKCFDQSSSVHYELQDEIIRKKQLKIDQFSSILNQFRLNFDQIM